ncbi:hypothetical protein [Nitrosomonas ureae]|uniref:Uncharacterized protein n=1 Tax=Nitrosomonas ureae TaxID=44577 RepID=A0A1H5YKB5_9PROT|nr:hypothetical protein [Nitrosomonas ureae]SEG24434.1 hypothetical protein SAMN05216334_1683 [Nitrosomonas ureae]
MHIKKIDLDLDSEIRLAPKIEGQGHIRYRLWVDEKGNLYVQFENNAESGTFSNLLFSVSKYESERNSDKALRNLKGYDSISKSFKFSGNNNDGAFLKAVLRHLLPIDE